MADGPEAEEELSKWVEENDIDIDDQADGEAFGRKVQELEDNTRRSPKLPTGTAAGASVPSSGSWNCVIGRLIMPDLDWYISPNRLALDSRRSTGQPPCHLRHSLGRTLYGWGNLRGGRSTGRRRSAEEVLAELDARSRAAGGSTQGGRRAPTLERGLSDPLLTAVSCSKGLVVRCAVAPSLAWTPQLRGASPQAHALSSRTPCQDAPARWSRRAVAGLNWGLAGVSAAAAGCRFVQPPTTCSRDWPFAGFRIRGLLTGQIPNGHDVVLTSANCLAIRRL